MKAIRSFLAGLALMLGACCSGAPVKLFCWIVADDNGISSHTEASVSNHIDAVNRIYSQVAMTFERESMITTNSTRLTHVDYSNSVQKAELYDIGGRTGGLNVIFVETINDHADAFCGTRGIVVSSSVNPTTLAHEIGHACGLSDIYDDYRETALVVTGPPDETRFTDDWGWYPDYVTQADIVRRLLMYGYNTTGKGDISRGDIYGLWYTNVLNAAGTRYDKVWQLGNAPVGFKLHGNRHPVSE